MKTTQFNAGDMLHRVDIQSPVYSNNSTGEREVTYTNVATGVPALVLEEGTREMWYARQTNVDATVMVRMRWTSLVTVAGRLLFKRPEGDRTLDVLGSSNPDGRRIELQVLCKENVAR